MSRSAHTITVGPDPDSVAPSAPFGEVGPQLGEMRRGGAAVRSRAAGRRRSRRRATHRPDASAAPSSVARATVNTASSRGTDAGSAARDCAVATRVSGMIAIGKRRYVVRDALDVAVPREADAAGERRREVVRVTLEREPGREQLLDARLDTGGPRAGDEAERDDAALEPRPRSRGIRSVELERPRRGRRVDRERAHAEMRSRRRRCPRSAPARSRARARRRRRRSRGRDSPSSPVPGIVRHRSTAAGSFNPWPVTMQTTRSP